MLALVFGITGQDGFYLKKLLMPLSIRVVGASRCSSEYINVDIADFYAVKLLLKRYKPDYIFHFSADSTTNHNALFNNHAAIATGTLNILEAARIYTPNAKIFLSGSALQFYNDGTPISETTPFTATSAYAVSRINSVYIARYYRSAFGSKVYVGYFFNHDSPRRAAKHVNQKIINYLKILPKDRGEKLRLGNIAVRKEFNYAGDIVEALWVLLQQEAVFEAVLGCGKAYSIRDWLEYCFARYGLNYEEHISLVDNFTPEYRVLVSNPELIMSLGWKPQVSFTDLADLMLE